MLQRVLLILCCLSAFSAMADDTVLKLYRPFGDVVDQAALVVKQRQPGDCYAQSQLIVREDAWRCRVGGKTYDPCFAKAGTKGAEILCPESPWVGDSVQVELNGVLNNDQHTSLDMSRTYPWAVELVNGERCQAVESSVVFDGMPVRYRCSGQNVLVGYLQRCKAAWSMLEKTPTGVASVQLRRAWF